MWIPLLCRPVWQDEIFNDFKFWEDASDQFRDGEGSLLPLWRFADNKTRRKQVSVCHHVPRNRAVHMTKRLATMLLAMLVVR